MTYGGSAYGNSAYGSVPIAVPNIPVWVEVLFEVHSRAPNLLQPPLDSIGIEIYEQGFGCLVEYILKESRSLVEALNMAVNLG